MKQGEAACILREEKEEVGKSEAAGEDEPCAGEEYEEQGEEVGGEG